MKKLLVGLLAAILMAAGFVATAPQPAQAACPYTGCFNTKTTIKGPTPKKATPKKATKFAVRVDTVGARVAPAGRVKVELRGRKNRTFTISLPRNRPAAGTRKFNLGKLPVGTYRITVRFIKAADSAFNNSSSKTQTFQVKKSWR